MKPKIHADLRNVLATLYPDERSIRCAVDDAGIDSSKMSIDAHALNSWHSVLSEAEKNYQVEALLKAVEAEYKYNQPFGSAYHAYRQSVSQSGDTTVDSRARSKPAQHWLFASIVGLLLVGIAGSGWYWGIPGFSNLNGDPLTSTPTIAATFTSTLIPNLSKSITLTPILMEETSVLSSTSMTALPTITPIETFITTSAVTPTPQPTTTVAPIPTPEPTPVQAADDVIKKTLCTQGIAYESINALKLDLLNNAKKAVINELFGEFIIASTAVENFVVTKDQIQTLSIGFVRVDGNVEFFNSSNGFAEVCVTIQAYVTKEDKAKFFPQKLTKKYCDADEDMTTTQLISYVQDEAIIQALIEYAPELKDADKESLLQLVQKVTYSKRGFISDTQTYCATFEGEVVPVEAIALLETDRLP